MGLDAQMEHDDRYDLADEYLQVVYALWEGGWADDAVIRDRTRGIYTDPRRVRGAPPRQAVSSRRRAAVGAIAAAYTGIVPSGRL
jgi:alkanesulfonate monooxygenase SsuD/methylene tetrahydromethanopterin reductase-like flavin-dependent oxidoreductase (luciferase family)